MKILILTGKFGMGHCCAAEALKTEIQKSDPRAEVQVADMLEEMFPYMKNAIYSLFNFMVNKCSGLYNFLNKSAGKTSGLPMKHAIAKRTERLVQSYSPDLIISTLPLCSQFISAYKTVTESKIPLYTYITDVIAHEEWIEEHTDCYFVAAEITKEMLRSRGIEPERIRVSGIPVRAEFHNTASAEPKADKAREILIMGGGLGLIPGLSDFLGKLSDCENIHVTLIAGRNKELYEQVKADFPRVHVLGYTSEVAKYMKRADLLVTKSGGITTFEAIHSQTPMYIIKPFLMQEIGNAEFISTHNFGRIAWNDETDMASEIIELSENTRELSAMKANMRDYAASLDSTCPIPNKEAKVKEPA